METRSKCTGTEEKPQLDSPISIESIETISTTTSTESKKTVEVVLKFIEKHPIKAAVFVVSLISGLIAGWLNGRTN